MALANCRHMFRPYFGPHQYSSFDFIKFLLGERYSVLYNYLPEWRILHELICGFRSVQTVVFAVKTS